MMTSEQRLARLDPAERQGVYRHLEGGTSTNWLSAVLKEAGCEISPTSLKRIRARLRNGNG